MSSKERRSRKLTKANLESSAFFKKISDSSIPRFKARNESYWNLSKRTRSTEAARSVFEIKCFLKKIFDPENRLEFTSQNLRLQRTRSTEAATTKTEIKRFLLLFFGECCPEN